MVSTRPRAVVDEAVQAERGDAWRTLPAEVVGVDVDRLITVRTQADVVDRRARLVEFLWKGSGLPTASPELEAVGAMTDLDPLEHAGVERATLRMHHGLTATSYLVHPRRPVPGRFGCFIAGHGDGRQPRYHQPQLAVMRTLLERGYLVGAVDLPLQGWNSPDIDPPDDGGPAPADPRSHELFSRYERPDFSAATYFIDPVVALVNHAATLAPLTDVATFGFSGGAWATVLHAAVDPRVTQSVQVAGTWPFYLRPHPAHHPNFGDWEQRRESLPGLYDVAGYLDLYVLGGAGAGRRQLQVLNRFDPSCFPGVGSRSYAQPVRDAVATLDGEWDVVEDPTHGAHQVSPYAVALLAHELDRRDTDPIHPQKEPS